MSGVSHKAAREREALRKRQNGRTSLAESNYEELPQTEDTEAQMFDSEVEEHDLRPRLRMHSEYRRSLIEVEEEYEDSYGDTGSEYEETEDDQEDGRYGDAANGSKESNDKSDHEGGPEGDPEGESYAFQAEGARRRKPAATRKKTAEIFDPEDFGISDVGSWLQENRKAWANVPSEDDWPLIRTTGLSTMKDWNLNMSIEAAFREFEIAGAPVDVPNRRILHESSLTRLLREAVGHIRKHFDSATTTASPPEAPLTRSTRGAAVRASLAHLAGKPSEEVAKLLPAHSKILACMFTSPNAKVNSTLSGALFICNHTHLMGIGKESAAYMSVSNDTSGEPVSPLAQDALNLAIKLETDFDNIKQQQADEISSIDETLTQVMQAFQKMKADFSTEISALKAQNKELTDRCSKTEDAVTDLRKKANGPISVKGLKFGAGQIEKKSIRLDHLTDEVAGMIDSGTSFGLIPENERIRPEHAQLRVPAGSRSGNRPPLTATAPTPAPPSSQAKRHTPTAASSRPAPKRSKTMDERNKRLNDTLHH